MTGRVGAGALGNSFVARGDVLEELVARGIWPHSLSWSEQPCCERPEGRNSHAVDNEKPNSHA
eukprot:2982486-Rhodomonas_salina.1